MRKLTRSTLAAVPLALLLALSSACGAADSGDPEAKETLSDAERKDGIEKYTDCLRDNGMDLEDPKPGEGVMVPQGSGENDAALEACRELSPEANGELPEMDPEMEQQMIEYAQCMRDNGVEAFPDPAEGATRLNESTEEDPDFEVAAEACTDMLPNGGQGGEKK